MKRIQTAALLFFLALVTACRSGADPSSHNSNQAGNQNSAQAASAAEAPTGRSSSSEASSESAPRLEGTYEISEVHSGGVINIISTYKTLITFFKDGTYSRISREPKRPDHRDAGDFRIAGDQLVLMIKMTEGKIFQPPREITHTFSLSPDGAELQLKSAKGNLAIFRRTAKPSME